VTPEYNRSVPGGLKNAIDVGSRPYGKSVWTGKPAAVVSVSPGAIGGFGANHHLRQSFVFLEVPAMPSPEAYIGGAAKLFDEQGTLTSESTREFITKFMQSVADWVQRSRAPPCAWTSPATAPSGARSRSSPAPTPARPHRPNSPC